MPKTRKSDCLKDLKARILAQDIAPGSDLDEQTLCEAYGISRTPLREVLHRLAGDGYLRLQENRGAAVASMDIAVMRTFFQTAPLVYSSIARLAAENRTTAQLDRLKDTQGAFAKAARAGEAAQAALLNHRFHEEIGQMAQNPYLFAALGRMLIDHTRLSQTFFRPASDADTARVAKSVAQHDAMIAAFEAHATGTAVELTLAHWELSRDQLERYVRPDPLPLDLVSEKDRAHAL
ncbi:MAG: GntR family transcriptional regulator [Roseobacter sp.]